MTRTCGNCRHSMPLTFLRCRWQQQRPPVGEYQTCRMTPPKHEYGLGEGGNA